MEVAFTFILSLNGKSVTMANVAAAAREFVAGSELTISLVRDGNLRSDCLRAFLNRLCPDAPTEGKPDRFDVIRNPKCARSVRRAEIAKQGIL